MPDDGESAVGIPDDSEYGDGTLENLDARSLFAANSLELPQGSNADEYDLRPSFNDRFSVQNEATVARLGTRTCMLDQALGFIGGSEYRRYALLQEDFLGRYDRNIERDDVQREANLALQRADCRVANFADYIAYELDEWPYNTSSNKDHAGTIGTSSTSGHGTSSAAGRKSEHNTRNYDDDNESAGDLKIEVQDPAIAGKGVVEELVSQGWSPAQVAKLSDVFEHPISIRNVDLSLIPWVEEQHSVGYWRNHASLFILCLTIALSVGSVETVFKLNITWGGLYFLIPYFFAYILVIQPVLCFELTSGQIFRGGPAAIFRNLVPCAGGIGTGIVFLCILSGCVAAGRSSTEYMLYIVDVFKAQIPWKLTTQEIAACANLTGNDSACLDSPICTLVEGNCVASALSKAHFAYRNKFNPGEGGFSDLDLDIAWGMGATYLLVIIFQMVGLTNFTFCASILIILTFFLTHLQLCFTIVLEGAADFIKFSWPSGSITSLFESSRIWSHTLRSCIYEYIVGNGVFSTLASKCRLGYDASAEAVGIGCVSAYLTSLSFVTTSALIGHYMRILKAPPADILSLLGQDSSYILLPLGFQASENMERTLCLLQFGCLAILLCATLAVQVEVAVVSLKQCRFSWIAKRDRRILSLATCGALMLASLLLTSRRGKDVVWFLEVAVGDLGRVLMVLLTTVVVGWLYGCAEQKEAVGVKTLHAFNAIFWISNATFSICEASDETILPFVWWLGRLIGLIIATIVALLLAPSHLKKRHVLWWLYFGNVEKLRREICRIAPMNKVSNLPISWLWSASIKWFAPCMLSSAIADIFEELISPERLAVNITNFHPRWIWITIVFWTILVLGVSVPPLVEYWYPHLQRQFDRLNVSLLPTAPNVPNVFVSLLPRYIFLEFYKSKKS